MMTIEHSFPAPSLITASSSSGDHFRPTPVPIWVVLTLVPVYEAASFSASRRSAISCSRAERGLGAEACRRWALYASAVRSALEVAK